MNPYLPHTQDDVEAMLGKIGVERIESLFEDIPSELILNKPLGIPNGISETELSNTLNKFAKKNKHLGQYVSFLGGGAYDHYIPSVVQHIVSRSEFYTAYTPYQAEISQGTLQSIFEYQTMITRLTNMDVSNASLYDGATAAAEGIFMACSATRKKKVLLSETCHPMYLQVIKTYLTYKDIDYMMVDSENGTTSLKDLDEKHTKEVAAVFVQSPNFLGNIEDITEFEKVVHKEKSLLVMGCNPISLGLLKTPGEYKADIAVGEGQCLGNKLNYGGPYLGFITCTKKLMRKLPGRIVGQTTDQDGNRGYVLTLQAREQHIRREKATSNITSNQALNALASTVYMATMGKEGLKEVATQCFHKAHYLAEQLVKTGKFKLAYPDKAYYHEFVLDCKSVSKELCDKMLEKGYIAGIPIEANPHQLLICVTEKRTREEMDDFVKWMEVMG